MWKRGLGKDRMQNTEIFDHAAEVMGSEAAAKAWMNKATIGLANQKPVYLLATSAGVTAVKEYLTRLEYGVYP